jgi:hypothetical protein
VGWKGEKERVARRAERKRRGWFSGLRDFGLAAQKLSSLYLFYFLPTPFYFRFKFECKFKFEIPLK